MTNRIKVISLASLLFDLARSPKVKCNNAVRSSMCNYLLVLISNTHIYLCCFTALNINITLSDLALNISRSLNVKYDGAA